MSHMKEKFTADDYVIGLSVLIRNLTPEYLKMVRELFGDYTFIRAHEFIKLNRSAELNKKRVLDIASNAIFRANQWTEKVGYSGTVFVDMQTRKPELLIACEHDAFLVRDYNETFYFRADYNDRNLDLDATLVVGSTPNRHPLMPHLSDLIPGAISYFELSGKPVRALSAAWSEHYNGQKNTNYQEYKKAVNEGFSPEEAVFLTPTGKIAYRSGFTKVQDLLQTEGDQDIAEPGVTMTFIKAS